MIEYQQQEAKTPFVQIQSRRSRVKCLVDGELSENEKNFSCVAVSASRCSSKRKLSFGAFIPENRIKVDFERFVLGKGFGNTAFSDRKDDVFAYKKKVVWDRRLQKRQKREVLCMTVQKRFSTQQLVFMAVLVAMNIILSRFLSIAAWNLKIGFAFLPVVVAAIYMGPLQAAIVGALGDLLGATMFPIGAYFPGFTVTAFLVGLTYGYFLHKKQDWKRILLAVLITEVGGSLLLNTLWISILYGSPFFPLLLTRVFQIVIMGIVEAVVIRSMTGVLVRLPRHAS